MMLVALVGLCVFALVPLLLPLLRKAQPAPDLRTFDRAVYLDQLRELDRDVARGLVAGAESAATRLEIQRRLLAADATASSGRAPVISRSPVTASFVAAFVAAGAGGLYARLGAPAVPDTPFVATAAVAAPAPGEHGDLRAAAAKLAEKLKENPADADRWLLYARTTGSLRQWEQSADAYRHLIALGRTDADVQSGLGEMLVLQAAGIVTPAAHDALVAALRADPKNDVAQYYMALAAGQAGEPEKAITLLQGLLASIPEDSPMRQEIAQRINEAAKAAGLPVPELAKGTPAESVDPDEEAMESAAGMRPEQQKAMIAGMVAKLAARLEQEPDDAEGWMRLGRAYAVMESGAAAAAAYERAAALRPDDADIRIQAAEGLMTGLKPEDTLPPRAMDLIRQAAALAPDAPAVLWYLGVDAARASKPAEAKKYWTRLLTKLPTEGDDTRMVRSALRSLDGG